MAFDKSLDKELFGKEVEFEKSKIRVSIFSYNEGQQKIQFTRENKNAEGHFSFAKLGRMTKQEATEVLPLFQEAVEKIE